MLLDPARLTAPAPAPRVHIEEVWMDGIRQPGNVAQDGVTVPSGTDRLEILYTGLEFSALGPGPLPVSARAL